MSALNQFMAQVCSVLLTQWDPIDVDGVPQAQDEYDAYAPAIAGLVTRGESAEMIAKHLIDIERSRMGLAGDEARAARVARTLLALWH